jgi:hypothetical protein
VAPATKPFRIGSLVWPVTARQWQALSDMVEDIYQRLKEGVGQVRTFTGDVTGAGSDTVVLTITADTIVNADINSAAGIVDTKLATITTAGKVSNSATTATSANTASAIVARDANGDFIARYIGITRLNDSAGNVLLHLTGTQNTFIGTQAGNLTTSGTGANTAIGFQAGTALTTGYQNTLIGRTTGTALTTGYGNTFIGRAAGVTTQDGYYNVFVGISAGAVSTTGYQNCLLGSFTGSANTTGFNNTFLGDSAGRLNVDGASNTFVGRASGDANTDGDYGVFMGHQAGFRNTTGDFNTFLGDASGLYNTTGTRNVAVGELALSTTVAANSNVSGSDNTCVGYDTGPATTSQYSKSTAIGQAAKYAASNALVLGGVGSSDYVNVGIGLTTPTQRLDAVGQTFLFGSDNTSEFLRTNSTNKVGRMFAPHYTNAEEPVFVIGAVNSSTANIIFIGGGSVAANASTRIEFVTAATGAVTTGTSRWVIDENGWLVSQSVNYDIAGVRNVKFVSFLEGTESTAPAAGAVNTGRIFFQDNGAGKTQLMVLFNTGVAQQIAIQP